jgi:heat shock protein HtpX
VKSKVINRLASIQRAFVLRWSESLRDEVVRHCSSVAGPLKASSFLTPLGTARQLMLVSICLLIYLNAVAIAIWGLFTIATATVFWHYIVGLFALLVAWFARPRRAAEPERPLDPARYPAIHQVVRLVSDALQSPPIDSIEAPAMFNASYSESAGGRRRHIQLGSMLMAALTDEQRIAVVAHEVAHGVNRDPLRSRFVHGAIHTLCMWALSVRPLSIGRSADHVGYGPLLSVLLIPFEFIQLAFSELLFLGVRLILLLAMRQSQQAEFFADILATSVAGTEAMISALERLHQYPTVELVIQRAHLGSPDAAIEPMIRDAMQSMTISVAEDYRQRARKEQWQEDSTHPPTASRIDVLRALPAQAATIVLDEDLRTAFQNEVAALVESHKRSYFEQRLIELGY